MIADADVGIYCSAHEGLPRAIVQYCAVGKPVVAMALPGLETLVQHDQNGIVLRQNDFAAMGDSLLHLARNNEALERLSRHSAKVDLGDWSVERMCHRIDAVYRAIGTPNTESASRTFGVSV